jgi:antibiotic biosynthesis monooxygenase (ABM) superfamily enzyme
MLVYNVTIKILRGKEEEWLQWMTSKHIPDVMSTGFFLSSQICRLLDQPEGDDPTYVIQYRCESKEKLDHYLENFSPALREEHNQRYKDQFVAFRTVMEVIE